MAQQAAQTAQTAQTDELTSDELLVEEVSIDGMCGVY
jgi:mycofactocin precursor